MLSNRLALTCDHPSCPAELLSGPLEFHGTMAAAVLVDEGPVVGPWHYCPRHMPEEG